MVKIISSVASGAGKGVFGTLLVFIFRNWRVALFSIAMIIILWNSILLGIEQKSLKPISDEFGSKVLSADLALGQFVKEHENEPKGLWDVMSVSSHLWILYMMIFLIYKAFGYSPLSDVSNKGRNILFAIILIWLLQSNYCLYTFEQNEYDKDECYSFFPGTREFLSITPTFYKPFLDKVNSFIEDKFQDDYINQTVNSTLNSTINTTYNV